MWKNEFMKNESRQPKKESDLKRDEASCGQDEAF